MCLSVVATTHLPLAPFGLQLGDLPVLGLQLGPAAAPHATNQGITAKP